MTQQELDIFLNAVTVVGAAGAIVNALRYRSRGPAAFMLAFGFLLIGGIAQLYRANVSDTLRQASLGLLFAVLIADFAMRAGKTPPGGKKR